MTLPQYFCWTRFGTEAAQTVEQIFSRKEEERCANGGKFLWGIGNAIGPSLRALLQKTSQPEVLFSPIKAAPKSIDVAPESVVAWTRGETLDGGDFLLPEYSLVTSRYNPGSPKATHYALVCQSDGPLALSGLSERVWIHNLCNILTGRPIGASQVTAVVEQCGWQEEDLAAYPVAVRAKLVTPFFVRLMEPVPLAESGNSSGWADIVRSVWASRMRRAASPRESEVILQKQLAFDH